MIELMIVVAVIGILAAIAIPKFSDMVLKANERAAKGGLGAVRSALNIYYGDLEGQYPTSLSVLTVNGRYLTVVPSINLSNYHWASNTEQDY